MTDATYTETQPERVTHIDFPRRGVQVVHVPRHAQIIGAALIGLPDDLSVRLMIFADDNAATEPVEMVVVHPGEKLPPGVWRVLHRIDDSTLVVLCSSGSTARAV